MYIDVHVDEKWFHLSESCTTFYFAKDEPEPERVGKRKSNIWRLCFFVLWPELGLVKTVIVLSMESLVSGRLPNKLLHNAPPRIARLVLWKTRIWRSLRVSISVSCLKKCILLSAKSGLISEYMFGWFKTMQPYTLSHLGEEEAEGCKYWWNIELVNQPSNSQDFNILDLGFSVSFSRCSTSRNHARSTSYPKET